MRQSKEQDAGPVPAANGSSQGAESNPKSAAKPVSVLQLFAWIAGGMSNDYLMKQVRGQGLSFTASDEVIENARSAGADSDLANELKGASQTAVTANSPEADAVRGMVQAAIAIKRGEYRGAQHQIRTLLRADSQNPDLYFALGNTYQQMQDWDNAGEAYTRAIQLEPDFAYANGQLSFMYYKIGDTRGARSAAR